MPSMRLPYGRPWPWIFFIDSMTRERLGLSKVCREPRLAAHMVQSGLACLMRLVGVSWSLLLCSVFCGAQTIKGEFALQGQKPQTEGYLKATLLPGSPLIEKLDLWMTEPGKTQAIRSYQVEMTKKLHLIVVSADFKTFLHEHPVEQPDGHLVLTQRFPVPGTYYLYADALPNQLSHQVFRYQLTVGAPSSSDRRLPASGMGVQVGPYEVDLSSVRLHAGTMSMLDVNILKDGKPATDLHPYLGVPAHAVFLDAKDLSYVHTHPMAMGDMMSDMSKEPPPMPENGPSPSAMMLHVAIREPGSYKLWLQFRGGKQVYVAEFTITAL